MVRHPAERWSRLRLSRREFLRRSAAGLALPSAAAILAACGGTGGTTAGNGGEETPELRIGTPENPVELQIFDDNQPIADGLEPEAGPLRIFNWADYFWKRVLDDFGERYGVEWEYETFYNMEEAISKIETGQADFDVFFPTIDVLPGLVARKLIQPLNHSYLPNLQENVWPSLADPFYDKGSRYTVPYTIYHTGIGWRTDMVPLEVEDLEAMENAYDVYWNGDYAGIVGLYDDYREALTVGLLRNGIKDVNTGDPAAIETAQRDLLELVDLVNLRFTIDGAYAKLPEGVFGLHEAWSGDMVATPYYFPSGEDPRVARYYWPGRGPAGGTVGNDCLAIPRNAKNPVLAHHFLNFYCDFKVAMKNFSWVGYQPPQNRVDPEALLGPWNEKGWVDGYVLDTLATAVIYPEDFEVGLRHVALPAEVDQLWQNAFATVKAGG
jgi:spermidine/putrescine transport system substrate-binding protein